MVYGSIIVLGFRGTFVRLGLLESLESASCFLAAEIFKALAVLIILVQQLFKYIKYLKID